MPTQTVTGASGEGHAVLGGGGGQITDVAVSVTTIGPKVQIQGNTPPLYLSHFGIVGLGCFPDDAFACTPPIGFFQFSVAFDNGDYPTPAYGQTIASPSVYWRFNTGCIADITVFW